MSTNVMKLLFLAMALACVAAGPPNNSSEPEISDEMKNMDMNEERLLPKPLPIKPRFVSVYTVF